MNKLYSALGALAVIAIAVVFIVQFRPATGTRIVESGPQCIAEPHGACIPASNFIATFRMVAQNRSAAQIRAMGLKQTIAEGLIERWTLTEDAKRLGLTVSDDDVSRELHAGRIHFSVPAAKSQPGEVAVFPMPVTNAKTKQFDLKLYEKNVRQLSKMSLEEFREYQRQELLADRMREIVEGRVHVGDQEAFDEFQRDKSTGTIDYVKFERKFYVDTVIDPSPKAVSDWADKNKEELDKAWEGRKTAFLPECRVVRDIYVRVDEGATDDQKAAAKKKIDAALDRIQKGEDFGDVARDVSDHPSASKGGDLGCIGKGQIVKPVEDAVFSMDKGKVSGVITAEEGFHVVKVEQIAKDLEAERLGRLQIDREMYTNQEAERLAAEGAKEVLAAIQGGKSLKDAVDAYMSELKAKKGGGDKSDKDKPAKDADKAKDKDKKDDKAAGDRKTLTIDNHPDRPFVQASLPFNESGEPISGVKPGTDVPHMAFALAKAGDAPNDIVPLEDGYAVFQLKEKKPATKEMWEQTDGSPCAAPGVPSCRELYTTQLRRMKQHDALVTYVKRLKSSLAAEVQPNAQLVAEPKNDKNDTDDEDEGPLE